MKASHAGLTFATAALMAVGAAGCGSSGGGGSSSSSASSGGAGAKIAFLLPENQTARYEELDKPAFIGDVKKLCADCQVLYSNAAGDPAKQQQQAEAAITNGAKVLVIDAADTASAASIVAQAKQKNIPVVSYSRLVSGAGVNFFVSIDPVKTGQQQADALLQKLGGGSGKRIVMVNGSPTDSNSAPYKKGATDTFKKAGVQIVKSYDTPDWDPAKARTEMDQAISALGKNGFDAVYSANDGMAAGIVASLKAAGIDPSTKPVTGQDAEVAGVQRILSGDQLMTVYLPINDIAETAAKLAVPLAQGKQPPALTNGKTNNGTEDVPSVLLNTVPVDVNSINKVIQAGIVKTSDLCTGKFASLCKEHGIS